MINNKSEEDILHQKRRQDDLPESLQIARVNGALLRNEISSGEAQRRIAIIRAKFDAIVKI